MNTGAKGFQLTLDQVNYLNIGLMVASVAVAFFLPFELFLLAYAVLGPLHYLTEISWLHDRNYFTPKKWDWVPLALVSVAILLATGYVFKDLLEQAGVFRFLKSWSHDFTFLAFGLALLFVVVKENVLRVVGIAVIVVATMAFHQSVDVKGAEMFSNFWFKVFAIYLPTLLHVYVFTGVFMLLGSMKSRSNSGYLSVGVFVLCAAACLFMLPVTSYHVTEWARSNYTETFESLSYFALIDLKGVKLTDLQDMDLYTHPASIMLARFIGFAYTYHYLNWFSKTSVIRWHDVSVARFISVMVLWVASVGLYFYNYTIGFRWLFLLSFAHVLLEFPLNHQSFIGIGKEIMMRLGGTGGVKSRK